MMTDYTTMQLALIVVNILYPCVRLCWKCRFDLMMASFFLSIGLTYAFLKLFDIQNLYPAELWMIFNLFQWILFDYITNSTRSEHKKLDDIQKKNKELQSEIRKMNKLIKKIK